MKVYYPGPGQQTYHPELGFMVTDEPFELDDEVAKKYIKSGLLKEAKAVDRDQGIGIRSEGAAKRKSRSLITEC